MAKEILGKYFAGDSEAIYFADDGRVSMILTTRQQENIDLEKFRFPEPIAHICLAGDVQEGGYTGGASMNYTQTSKEMRLVSHSVIDGVVTTELKDKRGHRAIVRLMPMPEYGAFEATTEFINESGHDEIIQNISSFAISNLSPYADSGISTELILHRLRSNWSAEARLLSARAVEMGLERAWSVNGRRTEVFGSNCSMPARNWMPTAFVEDDEKGVTWGAQIYCPSAWQMEFSTITDKLSFIGGGGDFNFAHWRKIIKNGESFTSVRSVITCVNGSVDEAAGNLVAAQRRGQMNVPAPERELPIMFNEWCTTWGDPNHENLEKIAKALRGRGIRYLTIDAGWYRDEDPEHVWYSSMGDWIPSRQMFPMGLKATCDMIRSYGFIPGLWFEMESVGKHSKAFHFDDMLLQRDGAPIADPDRRFWNMENPKTVEYLTERVIGLLKECGFGYMKVDFNDTYGIGCDGYESAGEGVRRQALAAQAFFRRIRQEIPDIVIENCASGGHRLEPSMMEIVSQASFSDAHESTDIPVIAANLHREILPAQSQIWAVLHGKDSDERLYYSLIATMLGRMCLSGEVFDLSEKQWKIVEECMAFYNKVSTVIDKGFTHKLTPEIRSYRVLKGEQAVWREFEDKALLVVHRFETEGKEIKLPRGWHVIDSVGSKISKIEGDTLTVLPGSNAADAFYLIKD